MTLLDPETPLFDFDSANVAPAVLPEALTAALQHHFGLSGFRSGQQEVMDRVLSGRSTLALMPTGAGKSLCYQLPALLLPHATVVISPLIALMKDQLDGLPPAVRDQTTLINSSIPFSEVQARLRDLAAGRYKLVYVAPERLRQRPFLHALQQVGISLFVVDEAHCVSLWGFSFRPDYLFIGEAIRAVGSPPVLALTATATPDTQHEICEQLGALEIVRTNVFRPNLSFEVLRVQNTSDKYSHVVRLCHEIEGAIIVYVRSRAGCEELAELLCQRGIDAEAYHAGRADRAAIQDRFMQGETRVIAATIAFGMGVDKPDIRAVIHFQLPRSLEAYTQEAGRAGRDGDPSRCVLFYAAADKGQLTTWMREEAFSVDELRNIYRALRQIMRADEDVVPLEVLMRRTRAEETRLRVALGILERSGLVRRHFDLPATVRLRRVAAGDGPFEAGCAALGLGNWRDERETWEVAHAFDLPLHAVEEQLLEWQALGWVQIDGWGREMLLELLPPPPDSSDRIIKLLDDYQLAQLRRLAALTDYARSSHCRHRVLANHFGQRLQPCRDACDTCRRGGRTTAAPPIIGTRPLVPFQPSAPRGMPDHHRIIIEAVRDNPETWSSRELAHTLVGSRGYNDHTISGALAARSYDSIRAEIDVLVDAGHLAYRGATLVVAQSARSSGAAAVQPDSELVAKLKDWRAERARELGQPHFFILSNTVLFDIAAHQPLTLAELGRIKGIGTRKLEQWGTEILQIMLGERR